MNAEAPAVWIALEEAEYLLGCGEPYPAVAAALGRKPASLTQLLTRYGKDDLIPEGWR